jgi:hypothetical protein
MPSVLGIAPSSASGTQGQFKLPLELLYYGLVLVYKDGGGSPSDINTVLGDIEVRRNGVTQRLHTATQLERLNAINGSQYGRQQVNTGANMRQSARIFFHEPWRKDKVDAASGAWLVTADQGFKTFELFVTLAAAMPSTGSLELLAWVADPLKLAAGQSQLVKKVYRQSLTASGTDSDYNLFSRKGRYQVMALTHPDSAGVITKVDLALGGEYQIKDVTREDNVAHLTQNGMNPSNSTSASAFGYEIVFDADDPKESYLDNTNRDIWLKTYFSTAASGNMYCMQEIVGQFD